MEAGLGIYVLTRELDALTYSYSIKLEIIPRNGTARNQSGEARLQPLPQEMRNVFAVLALNGKS